MDTTGVTAGLDNMDRKEVGRDLTERSHGLAWRTMSEQEQWLLCFRAFGLLRIFRWEKDHGLSEHTLPPRKSGEDSREKAVRGA